MKVAKSVELNLLFFIGKHVAPFIPVQKNNQDCRETPLEPDIFYIFYFFTSKHTYETSEDSGTQGQHNDDCAAHTNVRMTITDRGIVLVIMR